MTTTPAIDLKIDCFSVSRVCRNLYFNSFDESNPGAFVAYASFRYNRDMEDSIRLALTRQANS